MAEVARRFRETGGSDVVRRLIARPIRLEPPRMPAPASFAAPTVDRLDDEDADAFADVAHEAAALEIMALDGTESEDGEGEEEDVVERLQAEMAVMKAILMAERTETAALRARIAQQVEPEPLGAEARATRERWAGIVDRILLSSR